MKAIKCLVILVFLFASVCFSQISLEGTIGDSKAQIEISSDTGPISGSITFKDNTYLVSGFIDASGDFTLKNYNINHKLTDIYTGIITTESNKRVLKGLRIFVTKGWGTSDAYDAMPINFTFLKVYNKKYVNYIKSEGTRDWINIELETNPIKDGEMEFKFYATSSLYKPFKLEGVAVSTSKSTLKYLNSTSGCSLILTIGNNQISVEEPKQCSVDYILKGNYKKQ